MVHSDPATERFNARPQSGIHGLTRQMRWVLGVVRSRVGEAQRASHWGVSLQTECAGGVPSFCANNELRREVEAAGNPPGSLSDVSLCNQMRCGKTNGGGGNCTLHPDSLIRCQQICYEITAEGAQEMCREDAALCELVASWHNLTLSVRDAIMELARCCQD
jgi:hypothetical protein